ncbi:MAG TPA: class I SAM-dependent methyltransferase [Candidatus Sumerlaeota bacterium]|nr:class I SAM-dependent methyltransferase [Candidatus Sumerlaeota bacterium]
MLLDDLTRLACPACGGALRVDDAHARFADDLPPGVDPAAMAWEGALACLACHSSYPLLEGVACLARLDSRWLIPLKEMDSRLSLSLRTIEQHPWEAGRAQAYAEQERIVWDEMAALFAAALDELDLQPGVTVLDVGAGEAWTTQEFQRRGARVVALDCDLAQLRYLSFHDIEGSAPSWRDAPYIHPGSGARFFWKDPKPRDRYFTRVFGDIGTLPFPSASFDIVFCRSVLHHLADHERTLREMARVVKPGGRIVVCAEPIRSILTDEEDCYDQCVQREEGMNERVWPAARFLDPVRPYADHLLVKVWPNPPARSLRRRLPLIAPLLARRIGPGARFRGPKLALLNWIDASINLLGRRNDAPLPTVWAGPPSPEDQAALHELVEVFRVRPGEIEAGVEDLPRKREVVGRLRRELLARGPQLPRAIDLARAAVPQLDRGWLDVVTHDGQPGRRMAREAAVTLSARTEAGQPCTTLRVRAARHGPVTARLVIHANGRRALPIELNGPSWVEARVPLPFTREPVVTLRLRAEHASAGYYGAPGAEGAPPFGAEPVIAVGELALE